MESRVLNDAVLRIENQNERIISLLEDIKKTLVKQNEVSNVNISNERNCFNCKYSEESEENDLVCDSCISCENFEPKVENECDECEVCDLLVGSTECWDKCCTVSKDRKQYEAYLQVHLT
jgi:hypothetical protein